MIITKTTKQIINDAIINYGKDNKSFNIVWVGLESLKKVEDRLTTDDFVKKIGDNFTYAKIKEAIHNVFNEELGLCKLQEQNNPIRVDAERVGSVSCEHNTGEDAERINRFLNKGVSSPVQNPCLECGHSEDKHFYFPDNGCSVGGIDGCDCNGFSPVQNPKSVKEWNKFCTDRVKNKCTCKEIICEWCGKDLGKCKCD